MRAALLLAFATLALAAPAQADELWGADLEAALSAARESGRPILIKFTATYCGTCKAMADGPLKEAAVHEALAAFERVALDVDEAAEVARRYRVSFLPTFLVLTPSGVVAEREQGFIDERPFIGKLRRLTNIAAGVAKSAAALEAKAEAGGLEEQVAWIRFLAKQGNNERAAALASALLHDPARPSGWRQRMGLQATESLLLVKRYDEARAAARATREVDPKDPLSAHALFLSAYSYESQGDLDAAKVAYREVLEAYPETKAGAAAKDWLATWDRSSAKEGGEDGDEGDGEGD